MKLPRPYIPIKIRIAVAHRQFAAMDAHEMAKNFNFMDQNVFGKPSRRLVEWLSALALANPKEGLKEFLAGLFGRNAEVHLDHDPPLCLREYNPNTKQYVPAANDPNYLRYINAESHRVKTFLRGEGARRSDMGQRRYLKRVHAKRTPKPRFKPRAAKQIRRIPHASVTTKNGGQAE